MARHFIKVLIMLLLYSLQGQVSAATDACSSLVGRGAGLNSIPPIEDVRLILKCADLTEEINSFDILERDLLVIRAKNSTFETMSARTTTQKPIRSYGSFIKAEHLEKLLHLVRDYYQQNESGHVAGMSVGNDKSACARAEAEMKIFPLTVQIELDQPPVRIEQYQKKLLMICRYLASHPGVQVLVAGHTDRSFAPVQEKQRGEGYAALVAGHLLGNGCPAAAIVTKSYGGTMTINNHSARSWSPNNRVELVCVSGRQGDDD